MLSVSLCTSAASGKEKLYKKKSKLDQKIGKKYLFVRLLQKVFFIGCGMGRSNILWTSGAFKFSWMCEYFMWYDLTRKLLGLKKEIYGRKYLIEMVGKKWERKIYTLLSNMLIRIDYSWVGSRPRIWFRVNTSLADGLALLRSPYSKGFWLAQWGI